MKVVMFNGLVEAYGTETETACFVMMILDVLKRIKEDDDSKILKFGEEVRKFERGCYLTPDSRLKAATVKRKKKEKQMEAKFGVI